jgi:type I restriction enzyme R subunit
MRYLLDTYIKANESEKISQFDDLTLVEMIVNSGIASTIRKMPQNIRKNEQTVAEVIDNNIRKLITEEKPTNPKYFEKMSKLLKEIITDRRNKVIEYEEYLRKIADLCKEIKIQSYTEYPITIDTPSRRIMYDNLENNEKIALAVDEAIMSSKADSWRGNKIKEKTIFLAIKKVLTKFDIPDEQKTKEIFDIVQQPKSGY